MSPKEYMALSAEYAELQWAVARGEDTPDSDSRMAAIADALQKSGLYWDPDSEEVRARE